MISLTFILLAAVSVRAAVAEFGEFDRKAQAGERLSVVFFGASLTWGANATDHQHTSYRARMAERLEEHYPKAHFRYHDAGLGGTPSQLGVFRLDRDCLRFKPDLVFLDFSANDDIYSDDPESSASYEAIVRTLTEAGVPVVQVLFPFKWNIGREQLPKMKRRTIHQKISQAYGTGVGDAIELVIERVASGAVKADQLWDTDPVHPGDEGYRLFAEAAWNGFELAVKEKRVGKVPETMLFADTYMHANRFCLATLAAPPAGWTVAKPALTAVNYDWLMSRWLDSLLAAANFKKGKGPDGKPASEKVAVEPLRLKVNASYVFLYGEASASSGRFRVKIDGQTLTGKNGQKKGEDVFEANRWGGGYGQMTYELARGLDTTTEHLVEIEPVFEEGKDQELRIESLCVAGGKATVEKAE
jgi:lysophospholipase L1-like esterase